MYSEPQYNAQLRRSFLEDTLVAFIETQNKTNQKFEIIITQMVDVTIPLPLLYDIIHFEPKPTVDGINLLLISTFHVPCRVAEHEHKDFFC